MNAGEVVVGEVKSNGMLVVLDLLAEPVRETCKPPHAHPHGEVLALTATLAE